MRDHLDRSLHEASQVAAAVAGDNSIKTTMLAICQVIVGALEANHKVLFAGNGGSAADSQHMAGEFVSRFMFDRPALPAIALTTDSSILTAIGNDYGYEQVFSRQVSALGQPGDVLFVYSTSGNSANVVAALTLAREKGMITVGLTGASGGRMNDYCDHLIRIPSSCVPRIQEGHLLVGHTVCELVEAHIFTAPGAP